MGHTRLGNVPKTQKWINIVQILTPDEDDGATNPLDERIADIVTQTLVAAQGCLKSSINDLGLKYTFYLLAKATLASREEDWPGKLEELGIYINSSDGLIEFTSEFQCAIDDYLIRNRYASDIAEIAQQAAGEALTYLAAPKAVTLFGEGAAEVKSAIKELSTKKGFSQLGQKFFGIFMTRFINFYLSRLTAAELGNPDLPHTDELSRFNQALQVHCEQSARIVHDFCGEWYSKTEYQEGINLENTSRFIAVALKKLQSELRLQEAEV